MTEQDVSAICDRSDTATRDEIAFAYRMLTANAPSWYRSDDEQEQRDFCWLASNGPQE